MNTRVLALALLVAPLWGCPPNAYQCRDATECEGGFTCLSGTCQRVCSVNNPCLDGAACDLANGVCLTGVTTDGGATTGSSGGGTSASSGVVLSSSTPASSGRASSGTSGPSTSRAGGGSSSSGAGTSVASGGSAGATSALVSSSQGTVSSTASSGTGTSSGGPSSSSAAPNPCLDGNGIALDGATCDDGNACTVNDKCDNLGVCQPGSNPCAGNPFHPVCNPANGSCGCTVDTACGPGGLCFGGRCLVTTTAAITACGDDGMQEEWGNGEMFLTQDNIFLSDADDYMGLRFTGTGIPANSTVFHAVPVVTLGPVNRDVREDWSLVMDPATPTLANQDGNISNRMPRSATRRWDATPPSGPASAPDFAQEVQELVALPTWTPTGAIMFVARRFTDSDDVRIYMCDDNDGRRPRLYLQYAPP